jgi:hypothetical protein
MRNSARRKQDVWFVSRTKDDSGIEPTYEYGRVQNYQMSVSPDSGSVDSFSVGLIPKYERYIVSFKHNIDITEGMFVYVDRTPEIDADGFLVKDENDLPTVFPDYIVDTIERTQKGVVVKINIKKANGDNEDNIIQAI